MRLELTAVIRKVPRGYIGFVEAVELVIATNREIARDEGGEATFREPLLLNGA